MTSCRDTIGMKVYGDRVPSFDWMVRRNVRPEVWWSVANVSWNSRVMRQQIYFDQLTLEDFKCQ